MKKILFIATGGTIASKKTENGLTPQITPEELLSYIPEVEGLCEITAVNPFNLDSSNVVPENWSTLVKVAKEHYEDYDGFVIAHGTDTMAYTAAALSYMIQNSEKPIVITGAQRPINLDITDAKTNLSDSFYYACDDASQGVQIVFDGKVIAGTRAKKVRTKSYNAFSSINYPDIAVIQDRRIVFYIDDKNHVTDRIRFYHAVIQDRRILRYLPMLPYEKPVRFYENLSDNVFLLKLIPGISPVLLPAIFEHYDAIIVESFGVGGIPASIKEPFYELCQKYPEKLIIMCTQVSHEGSDMTVYEVGHEMKTLCNILESYDMTPEAVATKTMWLLGNRPDDHESREKAFYKPINYDTVWK